jgi:hypothetical protein
MASESLPRPIILLVGILRHNTTFSRQYHPRSLRTLRNCHASARRDSVQGCMSVPAFPETARLPYEQRGARRLHVSSRAQKFLDYLLNKPMTTPPMSNPWLLPWFRLGHRIQILAMTFVAAQKGWDGITMIILMLLDILCDCHFGDNWMARQWLEIQGVQIETKTFQFGGRTQMLNAI